MNNYYVYILSNWCDSVLYVGVTSNLERRLYEHRNHMVPSFTSKYSVDKLVYYEVTSDVRAAIEREKQIKNWRREKKEKLIRQNNPNWKDLSEEWG